MIEPAPQNLRVEFGGSAPVGALTSKQSVVNFGDEGDEIRPLRSVDVALSTEALR